MMLEDVKTVAGAVVGSFVIVYGIQIGFEITKRIAKTQAKKEILEEMKIPEVKKGKAGEPIIVDFDGRQYYLKFEPIN